MKKSIMGDFQSITTANVIYVGSVQCYLLTQTWLRLCEYCRASL